MSKEMRDSLNNLLNNHTSITREPVLSTLQCMVKELDKKLSK